MSNMTYRDIPVLRSAGFEVEGGSWFARDKDGELWQVMEDDQSAALIFLKRPEATVRMSRHKFDELFNGRTER